MKYIWIILSFIYLIFTTPYFIYASQLDKNKALFNASGRRDFLTVRALLDQNADPNYQDPVSKDTPLVVANRESRSNQSSFLITDLLIRHKANVAVSNHIGKQALYYAASSAEAYHHFCAFCTRALILPGNCQTIKEKIFLIW